MNEWAALQEADMLHGPLAAVCNYHYRALRALARTAAAALETLFANERKSQEAS
jgi:hypothetical protein